MEKKIKAILIDDEDLAREIVKKYVQSFPAIEILTECSNGFEGIKAITDLKPDIVFLDIQMPKITGFEMLELLEEKPIIIFTTAYDQYALKAFEVNAIDYLLKPFSEERFGEAVDKAIARLKNKNEYVAEVKKLQTHLDDREEFLERVIVKSGAKISIIPIDKLNYLEAQDDYVMLYTEEGKFLKQKTMRYFEDHLDPADFIRIHRSYTVRLTKVKQIELFEKESYKVILTDGKSLPVSKSGYAKLKEFFN
ncbi:MAG: LytTR family transcriptional regulator DNA-binding domain-containing protein [Ignavibacteriales bacterium]|nr:LytTR family transcriptional regulator DNA-binding domain-containing protein [Ignavibacteriales bacterium]